MLSLKRQDKSKLTRQETAARLGVHPDTVDRWASAGLLRPMRYPSPGGGRPTIRYALAEIERFEREAQAS
jgi:predicted ArsR family transcriptional regulator